MLEDPELRLAPGLRRPGAPDQRAGGEDRAPDGQVEDDREVLDPRRAARHRPADDARGQDAHARDEGEPM